MLYNLSGHWTGYYTQHDHQRPISADLAQDGDKPVAKQLRCQMQWADDRGARGA